MRKLFLICGIIPVFYGMVSYWGGGDSSDVTIYICDDVAEELDLTTYADPLAISTNYLNCVQGVETAIFFSEYIEGSSSNKCLEVYNGTKDTIDLSSDNYQIQLFRNGSTTVSLTISLTGMLPPDSVHVVCDDSADSDFLGRTDQPVTLLNFNGDDALLLLGGGDTLDVFGEIGFDPGSQWVMNGVGTQNQTLIRGSDVVIGDTIGSDTFDPSIEWAELAQDDFSNLGIHSLSNSLSCRAIVNPVMFLPHVDSCIFVINELSAETFDTTIIVFDNVTSDITPFEESICEGDTLFFRDTFFVEMTEFLDTLTNEFGCDSILQLILSVVPLQRDTMRESICMGDSIFFGGVYQMETGFYESIIINQPCDRIVVLDLEIREVKEVTLSQAICFGDSMIFGSSILRTTGTYRDTTGSSINCDSITILELQVDELPLIRDLNLATCELEGDSLSLLSIAIDSFSNNYNYKFSRFRPVEGDGLFFSEYVEGSSNNKCLEIYNPSTAPIDLITESISVSFFLNGATSASRTIDLQGVIDAGETFVLCDDGVDIGLGVTPDTLVASSFFNGDDAILLKRGIDTLDIIGKIGEDPGTGWSTGGVSTLNSTLRRKSSVVEGVITNPNTFNPNEEWDAFPEDNVSGLGSHVVDITFDTTMITDILQDVMNGDSVIVEAIDQVTGCVAEATMLITINPSDTTRLMESICSNDIYIYGDSTFTESTITILDTLSNAKGCDSIVILDLTVLDTSVVTEEIAICEGDSIIRNGLWLKESGTYEFTNTNSLGCDSVTTVNLTVLEIDSVVTTREICAGDSVLFGGSYYDITGVYFVTSTGSDACDSVSILDLTVTPDPMLGEINFAICRPEGDSLSLLPIAVDSFSNNYNYKFSRFRPVEGDGLFFSEYVEGSSNNKCLEIYNPSTAPIDLITESISVSFFFNGATSASRTIDLQGVIDAGETFVLCDDGVDIGLGVTPDTLVASSFFNGDDAILLKRGIDTLDIIGKIGEDPGSRWSAVGVSTLNSTLRRKRSIVEGVISNPNTFNPNVDWDAFPQDDVSGLGSHVIDVTFDTTMITDILQDVMDGDSIIVEATDRVTGCVADAAMVITINPSDTTTIVETICANDNYIYGDSSFTESTITILDTLSNAKGCDSIVILDLTVLDTSTVIEDITICEGDSIIRNGMWLKQSGTFEFTDINSLGCDSVTTVNLTVLEIDSVVTTREICAGDSILFGGSYYDITGVYFVTSTGSDACDSVSILDLTVTPDPMLREINFAICRPEGDSLSLLTIAVDSFSNNYNYKFSRLRPIKSDRLFFSEYVEGSSNNKCLEIYNPSTAPIDLITESISVSFFFNGATSASRTIDLQGVIDAGETFVLCDDGVDIGLGVTPDTLVASSFFNGDDAILLKRGIDTLDIIGKIGEDPGTGWSTGGVSTLNSTLRRKSSVVEGVITNPNTFNPNEEWDAFPEDNVSGLGSHVVDITFDTTMITDILQDVMNGDSVIVEAIDQVTGCVAEATMLITINPSDTTRLMETICANDIYIYGDNSFTESTVTILDTLSNAKGCDSIVILDLTVLDTSTVIEDITICEGDSIIRNGLSLKQSGTFEFTNTNSLGCDSVTTVNLTVLKIDSIVTVREICEGDSILFGGSYYDMTGMYSVTSTGSDACDSVSILDLTLTPNPILGEINFAICRPEGDSLSLLSIAIDSFSNSYDYKFSRLRPIKSDRLFFSEYVEGSSNNKCLEIYNPSTAPIDLISESISVSFFFNGATSASRTIDLQGFIDAGATFVLCDDGVDIGFGVTPDTLVASSFFNGDDAILLKRGIDTLDIIGKIGEDPGSRWLAVDVSTLNSTLRRKSSVVEGVITNPNTFNPNLEWDAFPQDNMSGLGSHVIDVTFDTTMITDILQDVMDGDSIIVEATDQVTGCVEEATMSITINPSDITRLMETICAIDIYIYGDSSFTESTITILDTLSNAKGCDSIVILDLTVLDTSTVIEDITICEGDSIIRNGMWLKQSGTFEFTDINSLGCDSVTTVNLTVLEIDSVVTLREICEGDSVLFVDSYYDMTGVYFTTSAGSGACDSVSILDLRVIDQVEERLDTATLCLDTEIDIISELGLSYSPGDVIIEERLVRGQDLFISEYIEGSGFNKCIEVYNPTDTVINLSDYVLEVFVNGASAAISTFTLSGSVESDSAFVICDDSADNIFINRSDFLISTSWNGDDAIVLRKQDRIIDVFGRVGEDPGIRWGSGSLSSVDNTLVRNSTVQSGDSITTDTFIISDQWSSIGLDNISNLGAHNLDEVIDIDTIEDPATYQPSNGIREIQFIDIDVETGCSDITIIPVVTVVCDSTITEVPDTIDIALTIDSVMVGASNLTFEVIISNLGNRPVDSILLRSLVKNSALKLDTLLNFSLLPGQDTAINLELRGINDLVFANQVLGVVISRASSSDSLLTEDEDGVFDDIDVLANHVSCEPFSIQGDVTVSPPKVVNDLYCSVEELPDSITITPSAIRFVEALFISSYIEGSQFDKCVSLYNNTGREEDLSEYSIEVYTNGSAIPSRTLELDGLLLKGQVYTICNESADSSLLKSADLLDNRVMIFNGDDAIVLRKRGQVVDVFGRVGEDPGTRWSADGVESRDMRLTRLSGVTIGDRTFRDTFIISEQWAEVDTAYDFSNHEVIPEYIEMFSFYDEVGILLSTVSEFTFSSSDVTSRELFISSIDGVSESERTRYLAAVQLARSDLSCKGEVVISVDESCRYDLSPSLFLTGDFIPEFYNIRLSNNGIPISEDELFYFENQELTYTVEDICSSQKCWGTARIVREVVPLVQSCKCDFTSDVIGDDCVLSCSDTIPMWAPVVIDNCTQDTLQINLQFIDQHNFFGAKKSVNRTWLNDSDTICKQRFILESYTLDKIMAPKDSVLDFCFDLSDMEGLSKVSYDLVPWLVQSGDTITFDGVGQYCNIKVYVEDFAKSTSCSGTGSLSRMWLFVDGETGHKDTFYQHLETQDITPPSFELKEHPSVTNSGIYEAYVYDPEACKAEFILPEVTSLFDDCTLVELLEVSYKLPAGTLRKDSLIYGLEDAVNRVTITVTDECGNSSSKQILITVRDKAPPHPVCRSIELQTLNIYIEGRAVIPLEVFDEASWDGCGDITTRLGRRLDNKSTCQGERLTFVSTKELEFCCEDIGKTIPVSLTLIDAGGNRAECIVEVKINEKVEFAILNDTLRVDCYESTYPDIIGWPNTNSLVCYPPKLSYQDSLLDQDPCLPITIIRTWYDSSSMQFDKQVILRERGKSFHPSDIKWPLHYTGEVQYDKYLLPAAMNDPLSCEVEPIDGVVIDPFHCKLIGMSFEDIGRSVDHPCQPYYREWTVIDWCLYDVNNKSDVIDNTNLCFDSLDTRYYYRFDSNAIEDGFYTFQQQIFVNDNLAPFIDSSRLEYEWDSQTCEYKGTFQFAAKDTGICASHYLEYSIDYLFDKKVEGLHHGLLGNGDSVTNVFDASNGELIRISLFDECGNAVVDTLELSYPNNPKPDISCLTSISTTLDEKGRTFLWIDDVILNSDDCYEGQLYFSNNGMLLDSITLECEDFEGGVARVELYDRNINFICESIVTVSNPGICEQSLTDLSTTRSAEKVDEVIEVSPNPFSNKTRIHLPDRVTADIWVYNSYGQLTFWDKALKGFIDILATDLKGTGVYVVVIRTSNGATYQRKIILTQ